jgi:hypothetical protein
MDLDKENACITVSMSLVPSHYCVFSLPWFLFAIFWQWGSRPLVLPFKYLMPKGEKLRLKQLDQLPLVKFLKKISASILGFFIKILLLQKLLSCGGEI